MSSKTCFFCNEDLATASNRVIKKKGITSLIAASITREDEKHELLSTVESIKAHDTCYKSYVAPSNISAEKKRKRNQEDLTSPRTSRQRLCFNFEELCVICGEEAGNSYLRNVKKKGRLSLGAVHIIQCNDMQENIVEFATIKKNAGGQDILDRILNIRNISSVKARYHINCYMNLKLPVTERQAGKRESEETSAIMNHIHAFLTEHREECQFSMEEILVDYEGERPTQKWVFHKIKEKYKDDIIITSLQNRSPIISFKDTGHKILYDKWYDSREQNSEAERLRLVKAAAEIIVEDIRSQIYRNDEYPSPMQFFNNAETDIPDTLQTLLETIILKNKHGDTEKWRAKIVTIAHAIICAARPRSFLSPIQIGLASFLLKKYGSSNLLDLLSALGFSATYKEARLFEISAVMHPCLQKIPDGFTQFVFDNVDHDICTLAGNDTLHAMAGIQCITPLCENSFNFTIPKVKSMPSSVEVGKFGRIDLIPFNKGKSGLSTIAIENLQDLNPFQ